MGSAPWTHRNGTQCNENVDGFSAIVLFCTSLRDRLFISQRFEVEVVVDGGSTLTCTRGDRTARRLQAVDLFCGAGGLSLAAFEAGFDVAFAVENDKHAVKTYDENFIKVRDWKTRLYSESIVELDPDEIAAEHFVGSNCDIVLGGPPCQGFSTHRIKDAGVNDPRNSLLLSYFDFVKALSPSAFLVENVPGLLWPRHQQFLEAFLREANAAGYCVFSPEILDARDFGVPQRRKRVFILGVRDDLTRDGLAWPPAPTHSDCDTGLKPWVNCSQVFRPAPADDPNDRSMNHGPELIEVFRNTPPNGGSRKDSGRTLPCHREHDGHKDVYGRIDPSQPGPTMTTACINPSKGRFVHPTEHHGITVRQAARMQAFPDEFVFFGGLMAAGRQIGNAVPIDLGGALLQPIAKWLSSLSEVGEQPSNKEVVFTHAR